VIDGGVQLDVRIAKHAFDITCVDFNDKVADTDNVEVHHTEGAEEAIEFKLGLRVVGLTFVPGDRAKAQGVVAPIGAVLRKYPAYAVDGRIN